jgi:phosphoadenosine phosphosulfate reductase
MEISSDILGRFRERSIQANLLELADLYPGSIVFSTSFGIEDQAITHIISEAGVNVKIFTLDTGRLFPETYSTWSATLDRYKLRIEGYYPDEQALQLWVTENGPNAFYRSVDARKACCHIRKVEPLKRALNGNKVWVTGIRAAQSPDRKDTPILEWDGANNILKYNPLLNWSDDELNQFIRVNNVPYNPLHDRGFVSIGCAPCTRAIKPGEDFRAGRWWWEDSSKKECGLHVHTEQ